MYSMHCEQSVYRSGYSVDLVDHNHENGVDWKDSYARFLVVMELIHSCGVHISNVDYGWSRPGEYRCHFHPCSAEVNKLLLGIREPNIILDPKASQLQPIMETLRALQQHVKKTRTIYWSCQFADVRKWWGFPRQMTFDELLSQLPLVLDPATQPGLGDLKLQYELEPEPEPEPKTWTWARSKRSRPDMKTVILRRIAALKRLRAEQLRKQTDENPMLYPWAQRELKIARHKIKRGLPLSTRLCFI